MAGLKQIKIKIGAMQKSQTVTKAMEAVSAAKMRKAQQQALSGRAYARAAAATLARVSGSVELVSHPLTQRYDARKAIYIVITSDKGLAGALNSAVLKAAYADIRSSGLEAEVVAIGKKANDFFVSRGAQVVQYHANSGANAKLLHELVHAAAARYESGEYAKVIVVYQNFISTFEQRPTLREVFPLSLAELQKVVQDILPARGAYSGEEAAETPSTYTIEPSEGEVLSAILPRLASVIVYHALLESQASEHSARMVAMKSASDKAGEMQHLLTLKFNKARQAAITREVSEIIGGMEAVTK